MRAILASNVKEQLVNESKVNLRILIGGHTGLG